MDRFLKLADLDIYVPKKTSEKKKLTLLELSQKAKSCTKCKLSKTRTNVVFGEGREKVDLLFIGEGPGYYEDIQGRPFVGRAGQLLDKIIAAMKIKREDVYITNIVKCRPPQNRNPEPDEIKTCMAYLLEQIRIIKPKLIISLGSVAISSLLGKVSKISSVRGQIFDYFGIKLIPTYHPAYLLRNPVKKAECWNDIKLAMKELNYESKEKV